MSWIKPVGTKLVKYGPQAQLLWKHVAAPAKDVATRTVATHQAQRVALKHAETVVGGAIVQAAHQSGVYWVVFSNGDAVAAYPTPPVPLADLIAHTDLTKKMTPQQFYARRAEASRRRRAMDAARALGAEVRRRRDGM